MARELAVDNKQGIEHLQKGPLWTKRLRVKRSGVLMIQKGPERPLEPDDLAVSIESRTGVFPFFTTCFGPFTEAAGLNSTI